MEKMLKIGIVIADPDEYTPFYDTVKKYNPEEYTCFARKGISFYIDDIKIICVLSGMGKVNAGAVAMHLIDDGCNCILNFGLSGGISRAKRGQITIANRYLEHDFDLTPIGYKPCEKPWQKYIYDADAKLLKAFSKALPYAVIGTAACGDCFISNEDDRTFLKETFEAVSCDMETGAIAAVCDMADIPFLALRRISDDAGDDAGTSYREMNTSGETTLSDAFLSGLMAYIKEGDSDNA